MIVYKVGNYIKMMSMDLQLKLQNINSEESSPNKCLLQDTYTQNQYGVVSQGLIQQEEGRAIMELQSILKSQNLLLQFEEKRKNERMKEIEYVYTNGFNNYLWEKNRKKGSAPMVIINRKDMLQLDQTFPDELNVFRNCVLKIAMHQIFNINSKPNIAFLRDFYNFYPNWTHHISDIIQMELDNSPQIQNAFESEYTFPAKVLSSLKFSSNIELFCSQIFAKPLKQIINYNSQLSLDFNHIYQPWQKRIKDSAEKGPYYNLHKFIQTEGSNEIKNIKKLKEEVAELMSKPTNEAEKLIGEMQYFSLNKQAIRHLFSQIGEDEIQQSEINIKLAVLVWKKILDHRRKIESILIAFIDEILSNYSIFPKQVKFVMRQYHRLAQNKYGQVKYEDVRSFFNKVVYSQLLLPQFMRQLDEENGVDTNVKNFNIPILALFSQKIIYGQQFYEKQKYSYFNQLIVHYAEPIKRFMVNFLDQISVKVHKKIERQIEPMLLSFESIKYLYQSMKTVGKVPQLQSIEDKLVPKNQFQFGSSKYKPKDIYIIFINGHQINYLSVFKPKEKIKRIFIQFLMLIEKIPQPTSLRILLEQYKYSATNSELHSVELHANYLSLIYESLEILNICEDVKSDVKAVKGACEKIKIGLEKEFNLAQNMEKVYMKKLKEKQNFNAFLSVKDYMDALLQAPAGFYYGIFDGKVCEIEDEGPQSSLGKCLADIADYYLKGIQGYDALYHLLMQKVIEEVENQGIVDQATLNAAKGIIGCKLYELAKIATAISEKDRKISQQMSKHNFINLQLLQLPQYLQQQELLIDLSLPILSKLKTPQSPQQLLNIFYQVTILFQNIILITGKPSDITADVQIPLMILILIKSKLPNLSSILKFIQKFSNDQIHSSVMGQTLTLMSSVSYLIEQMGPKQFSITKQKYQQLCDKQQLRAKAELDRQYMIIDTQ